MKASKLLLAAFFILCSTSIFSQFFVEYKTGYDFSLNKYGEGIPFVSPMPNNYTSSSLLKHPLLNYNEDILVSSIHPSLGSGIINEISFGYKTTFFSIKLTGGANSSKLNFKNKFNTIAEEEITDFSETEPGDLPFSWSHGSNESLFTEFSYSMDFNYSIYYLNPEISVFYDFSKISVGMSSGITFNQVRLNVISQSFAARYSDTYVLQNTYYSILDFSPTQELVDELNVTNNQVNPRETITSYNFSLDFNYHLTGNFDLLINIKYKNLIYSPYVATYTDREMIRNKNGEESVINEEDSNKFLSYYPNDGEWWFMHRDYNFSTIGINLGVRYTFNQKDKEL